jgi:hypothetical protein
MNIDFSTRYERLILSFIMFKVYKKIKLSTYYDRSLQSLCQVLGTNFIQFSSLDITLVYFGNSGAKLVNFPQFLKRVSFVLFPTIFGGSKFC